MSEYANTTERSLARDKRTARAIRGLLRIAKIAMPDTYYDSDRRVAYARRVLRDTLHEPGLREDRE